MNVERSAAGLPPLEIEAHLNASAQSHSDWMAATGNFSHEGENGSGSADRIEASGIPLVGDWKTAENMSYTSLSGGVGADETDRMHAGLMGSSDHRANILDPGLSYVGVGLSVGKIDIEGVTHEVVFMTQNFAETEGEVLVQEEVDGQTVLQPYVDGEPVSEPRPGEVPDDPKDEEDESGSGGQCFVATAAYGGRSHRDVTDLRRFRDAILAKHPTGRALVRAYGILGPRLARLVAHDRLSGRAARGLISPLARLARRRLDRGG